MSREDLPIHEEKTGIDLSIELELLVYTYSGRHFHSCSHFPCSGTCEQAIMAKEILRLRGVMDNPREDK